MMRLQPEPQVDPKIEALTTEVVIGSPVARRLGIQLEHLAVDRVLLKLPFSPDNVTVGAIVHGGVIATLMDVAAAAVSVAGAQIVPTRGATSNLTIAYLAPADGSDLFAEAVVLRRGRRQVVEEVLLHDAAGTPIAKGIATSRID